MRDAEDLYTGRFGSAVGTNRGPSPDVVGSSDGGEQERGLGWRDFDMSTLDASHTAVRVMESR